jgi:hypothetical protein
LLFESLKAHTKGKVDWNALDKWRNSWNNCVVTMPLVGDEIWKDINAMFGDWNQAGEIDQATAKAIYYGISQSILRRSRHWDNRSSYAIVANYPDSDGKVGIMLKDRTFLYSLDNDKYSNVPSFTSKCNQILKELEQQPPALTFRNIFHQMQTQADSLAAELDPLILRPLIVQTRCNICPA